MEAWSSLGDAWVSTVFMQGPKGVESGPSGVYGLGGLLGSLEACRSVGHTSWRTLGFGALLVDDITLEREMCTLGEKNSTCEPTCHCRLLVRT